MGQSAVRVGVVDIGTNSMRLLITDGSVEVGRWVEVTGLGKGLDATGVLGEEAMERTISVLRRFGSLMDDQAVSIRSAIATSATRDALNREVFLDGAERALGVRPRVISGEREAAYAYDGALGGSTAQPGLVVSDIGGGSTEFVSGAGSHSVDIGSVRLTDRYLSTRPAPEEALDQARSAVRALFAEVAVSSSLIGVAGTWTSLGAIALRLPEYDRTAVHGCTVTAEWLSEQTGRLAGMSIEETAAIPSLDPRRAPVILGGTIVAGEVLRACGVSEAVVSERDSLDGVAMELLALP